MNDLIAQIDDQLERFFKDLEVMSLVSNGKLTRAEVDLLKNSYLARHCHLQTLPKQFPTLPKDQIPATGKRWNEVCKEIKAKIDELDAALVTATVNRELDPTLPGKPFLRATQHPIVATSERIAELFGRMGFVVEEGPELETAFFNFDALNTPSWHPAREKSDTLYLVPGYGDRELLRTETSPVQIHALERRGVPLRIISPGRVYRNDKPDATHSPVFYQVEGLCVDEGISMADLKSTLLSFYRELLGADTNIRFRPHFFPFTEPSAEVDVTCPFCHGAGCRICKHSGFIEMGGCGMVHPNVLEGMKINTERYTGFAFGLGIERLTMLLHGIDDIRLFYENDLRFLAQF